jgi:hypothetical protein
MQAMNMTGMWDSLSDWIDLNHTMMSLEHEVTALCKKVSMADRRDRKCHRFKEEKQWAQVQGNKACMAQMGWQVKRYSVLMQSFYHEATCTFLKVRLFHLFAAVLFPNLDIWGLPHFLLFCCSKQ